MAAVGAIPGFLKSDKSIKNFECVKRFGIDGFPATTNFCIDA
jgi:hypothetical protein